MNKVSRFLSRFLSIPVRITRIQEALGRIEQRQIEHCSDFRKAEFRVFSQWGEDGLIQYLLSHVPIERRIFVEFGVENYTESNTRFLLTNNQWAGLIMDGSLENISYVRNDPIYWATNLKSENAFITRENINDLISKNGITGDIGLLSVDIDGNDYWVLEAIDVISPRIIICEYNSQFGPTAKVTTPYAPSFTREAAHFSKIYYGASIAALNALALRKGYSLVASNAAGNNVFFVRNDLLGGLAVLTPQEAYVRAQFREFHDETGRLTFDDFERRLEKISHLPVYDLDRDQIVSIGEVPEIFGQLQAKTTQSVSGISP
jgi:hypothetical protein